MCHIFTVSSYRCQVNIPFSNLFHISSPHVGATCPITTLRPSEHSRGHRGGAASNANTEGSVGPRSQSANSKSSVQPLTPAATLAINDDCVCMHCNLRSVVIVRPLKLTAGLFRNK